MTDFINTAFLTAAQAATKAGKLALKMQSNIKGKLKSEKDVVTEADLRCDQLIRKIIEKYFPEHRIVTEEFAPKESNSPWCWYIDPIDGTVNYSRGLPLWGVSVALWKKNQPFLGVIYLPALRETYHSIKGRGAYLNEDKITVSSLSNLSEALVSNGDLNIGSSTKERQSHNREGLKLRAREAEAVQRVKCLGSAVVEGAWVACGRLDGYVMQSFKAWDVAATSLLVAEAGGCVTDFQGKPFNLESKTALLSSAKLAKPLLKVLA